MIEVFTSPLAWLTLSLLLFELAKALSARIKNPAANPLLMTALMLRSEERRVGKECRL